MLKNLTYGKSLFFSPVTYLSKSRFKSSLLEIKSYWAKIKTYKHDLENRHFKNQQLEGKELNEKHFVTQMIVVSCCHPY